MQLDCLYYKVTFFQSGERLLHTLCYRIYLYIYQISFKFYTTVRGRVSSSFSILQVHIHMHIIVTDHTQHISAGI